MNYIVKPALTLFITAVLTVTALSLVYNLTLEPIEKQKRKIQEAAMKEVLPGAAEYREKPLPENTEAGNSIVAVYEGILGNNALAGYVVQLSPEGYSGKIELLVGISAEAKKITGMRVLRHTETPGLGALSVKEEFYRRYDNKALVPLKVTRTVPADDEIQAITSATITTRAITKAVNEAIEWYNGTGEK